MTNRQPLYDKYAPEYGDDVNQSVDAVLKTVMSVTAKQKITDTIIEQFELCQEFIRKNPDKIVDGLGLVKEYYQSYLKHLQGDSIPEPDPTPDADNELAAAVNNWSNATSDAAIEDMQVVGQQFRGVVRAGVTQKLVGDFSRKLSQVRPPSVEVEELDPNESLTKLKNLFGAPTLSALPEGEE